MTIKVTFEGATLAEIRQAMLDFTGPVPVSGATIAVAHIPAAVSNSIATAAAESAVAAAAPAIAAASHATAAAAPATAAAAPTVMSVDDLKASINLKPTASTRLSDGSTVSPDDYLICNGEVWHVAATYRGTVIGVNEEGKADALRAENCVAHEATPVEPRAGTAAALLAGESKVTPEEAEALRDIATDVVTVGKVSAQTVFAKLGELHPGATQIEMLSASEAAKFRAWIEAIANPPAPEPETKKFGF